MPATKYLILLLVLLALAALLIMLLVRGGRRDAATGASAPSLDGRGVDDPMSTMSGGALSAPAVTGGAVGTSAGAGAGAAGALGAGAVAAGAEAASQPVAGAWGMPSLDPVESGGESAAAEVDAVDGDLVDEEPLPHAAEHADAAALDEVAAAPEDTDGSVGSGDVDMSADDAAGSADLADGGVDAGSDGDVAEEAASTADLADGGEDAGSDGDVAEDDSVGVSDLAPLAAPEVTFDDEVATAEESQSASSMPWLTAASAAAATGGAAWAAAREDDPADSARIAMAEDFRDDVPGEGDVVAEAPGAADAPTEVSAEPTGWMGEIASEPGGTVDGAREGSVGWQEPAAPVDADMSADADLVEVAPAEVVAHEAPAEAVAEQDPSEFVADGELVHPGVAALEAEFAGDDGAGDSWSEQDAAFESAHQPDAEPGALTEETAVEEPVLDEVAANADGEAARDEEDALAEPVAEGWGSSEGFGSTEPADAVEASDSAWVSDDAHAGELAGEDLAAVDVDAASDEVAFEEPVAEPVAEGWGSSEDYGSTEPADADEASDSEPVSDDVAFEEPTPEGNNTAEELVVEESVEADDGAGWVRRISEMWEVRDGGFGVGSAAPLPDRGMPLGHAIQAYFDTRTYRVPGANGYDSVEPDVWFYDEDAARRSGFTPSES